MDKLKTDGALGQEVHQHLVKLGLETPMKSPLAYRNEHEKIKLISNHFTEIMNILDLDLTDDSLCDTPNRVAKMYVREIFYGLDYDNFPKCTKIQNKMDAHGSFVLEKGINVQSNCEHHFVIIDGKASVAYIPKKTVLGLSKLNRIVEFFAKRPQVQERLTEQVRATIQYITGTEDVAVYMDCVHHCVKSRGVQDVTSHTVTFSAGGVFQDFHSDIRREFLNLCRS